MCGICGEFAFGHDPKPPDIVQWEHLIDLMRRRGPDGSGVWNDKRCLLGFRRLAIVDLSPEANQPMVDAERGLVLVFNGELYNFLELRDKLRALGSQFRTRCDSEVVLAALAKWGVRALELFNGMFAMACYDIRSQTLLLARDHAGMKPLYYAATPKGLVFASQYDQLISHPYIRNCADVCDEAILEYLRIGSVTAPSAVVRDTHMLSQGEWIQFTVQGEARRGLHYDLVHVPRSRHSSSGGAARLEHALSGAVARHMQADVPVGCFLSGGIDSPLLASFIAERYGPSLPAFTAGWDVPAIDESQDAAEYATALGVALRLRMMNETAVNALVDNALEACGEPHSDEGIIPALAVSELASREVKVALSGDGADELFWGYSRRQSEFLKSAHGDCTVVRWNKYFRHHSAFTATEFEECFPSAEWFPIDNYRVLQEQTQDAYLLRRFELQVYLPSILLKADRAGMFHSIEVRMPFLDKDIIEIAAGAHWHDCLDTRSEIGKKPLRELLRRRTGKETAGKRGFTAPMNEWIRNELSERVKSSFWRVENIGSIPVCTAALMRMWELHQGRKINRGRVFWRIFVLLHWLKRYGFSG